MGFALSTAPFRGSCPAADTKQHSMAMLHQRAWVVCFGALVTGFIVVPLYHGA